jgi:hypothetical protein
VIGQGTGFRAGPSAGQAERAQARTCEDVRDDHRPRAGSALAEFGEHGFQAVQVDEFVRRAQASHGSSTGTSPARKVCLRFSRRMRCATWRHGECRRRVPGGDPDAARRAVLCLRSRPDVKGRAGGQARNTSGGPSCQEGPLAVH